MKDKLNEIFNNLLDSLKTDKGGYSARKLTSITVMLCAVFAHYMIFQIERAIEIFEEILIIDFLMILALLGLVDVTDLIKHGREHKKKNDDVESKK